MVENKIRKKNKKVLTGYVISNKAEKTIVVNVETLIEHPLYKKYVKRRKKFMAHDPKNECEIGDKVQIIESRPLSKKKRWRLLKIVQKAQ